MPTNTYVALATQTITTPVTSVTFSSIPQNYTDLVVVVNTASSVAGSDYFNLQVGNGTINAANSSCTILYGTGSSASAGRFTSGAVLYGPNIGGNSTINSMIITNFMNYSNTTTSKSMITRSAYAGGELDLITSLWSSTSAIDIIRFSLAFGGNFPTGSTFSVYGIAATSVGAKATGGDIYSDASYFYHVFDANGTFTPTQTLNADILVVAGGGAGGSAYAGPMSGGGGAGGLLQGSLTSLASGTGLTVTVGAGGAGTNFGNGSAGNNGSNSTFNTATAIGGGGGAGFDRGSNGATGYGYAGYPGGSGGGNCMSGGYGGTLAGGISTQTNSGGLSGYGNAGGSVNAQSSNCNGSGGGGAGAAGENRLTSDTRGGNGGIGLATWSSWGVATGVGQNVNGTYYFAGGGGGCSSTATAGTGGLGGGGNGIANGNGNGVPGLANTGGGGGGSNGVTPPVFAGGNGGSGVVIVRYAR